MCENYTTYRCGNIIHLHRHKPIYLEPVKAIYNISGESSRLESELNSKLIKLDSFLTKSSIKEE